MKNNPELIYKNFHTKIRKGNFKSGTFSSKIYKKQCKYNGNL